VKDGYVSVTPLQPDLTAYDMLKEVEALLGQRARRAEEFSLDPRLDVE
jgi:hypothetical protein